MSAEQIIRNALTRVADGHVFPDVAKKNARLPWIVYQVVGGKIAVDLSGLAFDVCDTRVQITVWHETPEDRSLLMRQVVHVLVNPEVGAIPIGAPADLFEHDTRLHGSRLDVSISAEF